MKVFLKLFNPGLISVLVFMSHPLCHALFEARLSYGLNNAGTPLDQYSATSTSVSRLNPFYGIGGDLLFNIPLANWGVGVRYENLGLKVSSGNIEFSGSLNRTSALGYYRLIDTLIFLGPIVSFGLQNKAEVKVKDNGLEVSSFSSSKAISYTAGLEAGVRLIGILIGMEVGYLSEKHTDVADSAAVLPNRDIDLSGTYGKLHLGFSF